jgi:hypothetical protein
MPLRGSRTIIISNIIMQMRPMTAGRRVRRRFVCPFWERKNHILKYIVIILYAHKSRVCFHATIDFSWVFFVSFVYSTRVVNYRRRHRLHIRGRVPLYTGNNNEVCSSYPRFIFSP